MQKNLPLTCPCKLKKSLIKFEKFFLCGHNECEHNNKKNNFPIFESIPIIVSETRTDTICDRYNIKSYIKRPLSKFDKIKKLIIGESHVTKNNCDLFIKKLFANSKNPKVLIIGGAEKGSGTENLWNNKNIEIHSIDIYATQNVDVVCDSHYLGLESNYYDGVWIQAVLEHVVEPNLVVSEIYRVLKLNGIVYAETPFMQQVHEGAYDFNRYTVLGHRYLFKRFELIEIGGNKGPEVVFTWSVKYLLWSLFRSKILAKFIGVFLGIILRPLSLFISNKSMYDAPSGVFFLGKKVGNNNLTHKELIKLYKGNFK